MPIIALGQLDCPRILCLHGGGLNAQAFRLQCRTLSRTLDGQFRLVFANAPYESPADPKALPAYASLAPFRRWLRWKPEQPDPGPEAICAAISLEVEATMAADTTAGASGPWIAVMGFSQGAKVAASMLLMQQLRAEQGVSKSPWAQEPLPNFRFGVFLAGRAPLVALEPDLSDSLALADANELTTGAFAQVTGVYLRGSEHVLRIPTIHVHGLQDPGIEDHRRLLKDYCQPGTAFTLEWDGDHRVPIKAADVAAVAEQILFVAKRTGVVS
ncbi:MAG: hypothetical protein LQ340_001861 [Diploschistes diacapsis]|nr:MAG: hypothetical protein LQ340_001861 [Diploschistes diacapsis]